MYSKYIGLGKVNRDQLIPQELASQSESSLSAKVTRYPMARRLRSGRRGHGLFRGLRMSGFQEIVDFRPPFRAACQGWEIMASTHLTLRDPEKVPPPSWDGGVYPGGVEGRISSDYLT